MLRSKFDIEKNHQATYRDLHTVHTYSQLAVINIDSKKSLKGRKNETAYCKEEGIGISVSESLRLFCTDIPILSFVVLYAPSGTRYVWLHLQTWKDASFLYEMLNGIKVISTVELQAQKQSGVDFLESFSVLRYVALKNCEQDDSTFLEEYFISKSTDFKHFFNSCFQKYCSATPLWLRKLCNMIISSLGCCS